MARQQPAGGAIAVAVRQVLEPVVGGLGLVLEDVTVTPAGARRVLRVVLDVVPDLPADQPEADQPVSDEPASDEPTAERAEAGLSLDRVAEASREISAVLDSGDVMGATPYVLEVTSPGVDRPLTQPRHFRRNLRRRVLLTLADGSEVTGRVTAADEQLTLVAEGPKKGMTTTRRIAWDDVVQALVQVEFKPIDSGE